MRFDPDAELDLSQVRFVAPGTPVDATQGFVSVSGGWSGYEPAERPEGFLTAVWTLCGVMLLAIWVLLWLKARDRRSDRERA